MTKTNTPKVSVVMPLFKGDKYLVEALDSILNQTFSDFEFLIICDDPTDETCEILDKYMQEDARIRVHINQNREGLVNSLNVGIALAKGEYIARMDADDISLPDRLRKQVNFLDKNTDISILGTDVFFITRKGKVYRDISHLGVPTNPKVIQWILLFENCVIHPTVMFRKVMCDRTGVYSIDYENCEDYEFWLRSIQIVKIANLPDKLLLLRKHGKNISILNENLGKAKAIIASHKLISSLLDKKIRKCEVQTFWYPCMLIENLCVYNSAELLLDLYSNYLYLFDLSVVEKEEITRDAARRMGALATIAIITRNKNLLLSLRIWKWAFQLDKKNAFKMIFYPIIIISARIQRSI